MSEADIRFRASVFGGFNRQDVITYVEETTAEYARRIEQMQKELGQAKETGAQKSAELEQAQAECAQSMETNGRLTEEKNELAAELSLARSELEVQAGKLADAQRELQALREKVAQLEPAAQAFERIKERSASIELDAHVRAQRLLDETNAGIKATKTQVEQWLVRVQSSYDRLCTDMDATVSHASGELARLQQMLDGVSVGFSDHTAAFHDLLENWYGGDSGSGE